MGGDRSLITLELNYTCWLRVFDLSYIKKAGPEGPPTKHLNLKILVSVRNFYCFVSFIDILSYNTYHVYSGFHGGSIF